jgi:hypothetical protein
VVEYLKWFGHSRWIFLAFELEVFEIVFVMEAMDEIEIKQFEPI